MHNWGMGSGMGGGIGWGGMVLGPLLIIVLLVLLVALTVPFMRSLGTRGDASGPPAPGARDILDARYARGEIDREEYLRRRQDISGEA